METIRNVGALLAATIIVWLCVGLVSVIGAHEFVRGAAVVLALLSTVTIWSLWALNEYGISVDGTPNEKIKREAGSDEDPRLALMLALLTPDERSALQSRLRDELNTDGENVSLADLLANQEGKHTDHAS